MIIIIFISIILTCVAFYTNTIWLLFLTIPLYIIAYLLYDDTITRIKNLECALCEIFNFIMNSTIIMNNTIEDIIDNIDNDDNNYNT